MTARTRVTGAAEAFGDASSIAAQGRQIYDLSNFNIPAHPLPPGCNIRVLGISPGASLIGMKVFGNSNSSFDSTILQGLDYAVTHDHADVLSESFGELPDPGHRTGPHPPVQRAGRRPPASPWWRARGDSGVESSARLRRPATRP